MQFPMCFRMYFNHELICTLTHPPHFLNIHCVAAVALAMLSTDTVTVDVPEGETMCCKLLGDTSFS